MIRQLTDDVTWLAENYPLADDRFVHVSAYMIDAGTEWVLVDTGSFYHRDAIRESIDTVTDGRQIDVLILSHADLPHSGNLPEFRRLWSDLTLVSSSGSPEVVGLGTPDVTCEIGSRMEIAGRSLSFVDPPLADIQHTTWVYDHGSGVLFTADGFGNYHTAAQKLKTAGELDNGPSLEDVTEYNRTALRWLRFADPERLRDALDDIVERFEVAFLAPTHGNPIPGKYVERELDRLVAAAERISDEPL
jgi:flavorubredoxin